VTVNPLESCAGFPCQDCDHGALSIEPRPPAKIRQAVTTTHEIRTAGYVGGGFHLGHEECRIATIMSYYCGRNPSPRIGKMKKLLRHPGGHNRLDYSDNMIARAGGRGSVGLPNADDPLTFRHSGGMSEGLPLLRGTPGRTRGPGNPRWSRRYGSLD
jgi:hypothetical protein